MSTRASSWEYRDVVLPRGVNKVQAKELLVEQAETAHWELARLRILWDGRRHVQLRRRIIRVERTA